jgi:Leucine-rich repeat (LRR) protein
MPRRSITLVLALLAPLACGGDDPAGPEGPRTLLPNELCSASGGASTITFEDANLEAAVRLAFGIGASDDLTCDMAADGPISIRARNSGIVSLAGLQNLTNLYYLQFQENLIADLTPISGLTRLISINFYSNAITDISPVGGLTDLEVLELWDNPFTDLSPIATLTNLDFLELWGNPTPITDISALASLSNLVRVFLTDNDITDIGSLQGLTQLSDIELSGNASLADITALLNNTGMGIDDQIWLGSTSVSCTDVTTLEATGAGVNSDCP